MLDYKEMLDKFYKELEEKKKMEVKDRLEIPKPIIQQMGKNTVIINFVDICKVLNRDKDEFAKIVLKRLSSPGSLQGRQLFIHSVINQKILEKKLYKIIDEFVKCEECGKYDTKLLSGERNIKILVCEACGARRTIYI